MNFPKLPKFNAPPPPQFGQADLLRQKNMLEQAFKNSPSGGTNALQRGGAFGLGLALGWEVGGILNDKLFGQPQNITSEQQEQEAIKNYGKDLSNSVNDKKVHQPAEYPFLGGQNCATTYYVLTTFDFYVQQTSSWNNNYTRNATVTGKIVGLQVTVAEGYHTVSLHYKNCAGTSLYVGLASTTGTITQLRIDSFTVTRVGGAADTNENPPPTVPEVSTPPNQPYLIPSSDSLSNGNPNNTKNSKAPGAITANPLSPTKSKPLAPTTPLTPDEDETNKEAYPGRPLGPSKNDKEVAFNQPTDYPLAPGWFPIDGTTDYPDINKNKEPFTNRYVVNDPVLDAQKKASPTLDPTNPRFDGEPPPNKEDNKHPIIPPVLLKNPKTGTVTTPTPTNDTGLKNPTDLLNPPDKEPKQTPVPTELCQNPCFLGLKDNVANNSNKLDNLGTTLAGAGLGADGAILAKLNAMDTFLIAKFAALWQHRIIDRALNTFNFILNLHNAAMLSANLVQSLGTTVDSVVGIFLKDVDGQAFPVSQVLSNTFQGWAESVLGEHNYKTVAEGFKKANRILTATTNLFDSVKAMQSAVTEGLETVGSWVAKLNNGLIKEGIINEDLLEWRDESPEFRNHFNRAQQIIESLTEATESINQLASAVIETQEAVTMIDQNWDTLKDELADKEETKTTEEQTKTTESSTNATINNLDLVEGQEDNGGE